MAPHTPSSVMSVEEHTHSKELPPPGTDEENAPVSGDGNTASPPEVPGEKEPVADDKDQYLVGWEKDDPADPKNWSIRFKWWCTVQLGFCALAGSMGSSIISPGEASISAYTGVTAEAAVLCVSLYIIGFACGPVLWGPLSEIWGRKISMLPAMLALGLFSIGTATSTNAVAIFVTRFFGGVFGSAPVANVSAAIGDIWVPRDRGNAMSLYALCVVGGPTLGPLIGSALVVNPHLGWRWTMYIEAIWAFATVAVVLFCMPEMYAPVLLKRKAIKLRKETGDERYHHPHEDIKIDFKSIITKHLARPLLMLATEPMVTCIATYASFTYSLLYLALEIFPLVFQGLRGWGLVSSSLPFLGLFVGVVLALGINYANQIRYRNLMKASKGKPVPEGRLPPMLFGGVLFAVGLFWFGWTAGPSVHWISPVMASVFIGAGFNVIFQQCINYLVDTYQVYAASAVSANTILRSLLAGALPLAVRSMFQHIGVGPSMSILGGIAGLALPVPLLFMKFGPALRRMSRYAPTPKD